MEECTLRINQLQQVNHNWQQKAGHYRQRAKMLRVKSKAEAEEMGKLRTLLHEVSDVLRRISVLTSLKRAD